MAKFKRTIASLAILALVGVGIRELKAGDAEDWAGASISTTLNSGAATLISSNPGRNLIDGVILSSTIFNAAGYVEIRDSDTANVSLIGNGRSGAVLTFFSSGTAVGAAAVNGGADHMFLLPRAVRIYKGISVNAIGCAAGNSSPCFTLLYRPVQD